MQTLRDLPPPKVFFPLCSYDWRAHVQYFYSMIGILAGSHCVFNTKANMQDGVARARNSLAHWFLNNTDDEFLFWIAGDIQCKAADIDRILEHMVIGGHDIVGGLYPCKGAMLKWAANFFEPTPVVDPITGLARARRAGTDFLCIRRRVFETIREKRPDLAYDAPGLVEGKCWDFHPMPIVPDPRTGEPEKESEDWAFCRIARECGFETYVDTRIQLIHYGQIGFPLHATLTDDELADIIKYRYKADLPALLAKAAAPRIELPAT